MVLQVLKYFQDANSAKPSENTPPGKSLEGNLVFYSFLVWFFIRTCAYQGVKYVRFSQNLACFFS